jgi:hypothetical protein
VDENVFILILVALGLGLAAGAYEVSGVGDGEPGTTAPNAPAGYPNVDVSNIGKTSGGNLSANAISEFAALAGFAGNALIMAIAVALAESSGNPNAHGDIGIGQGSFGLWQINSYYHPEYGPDFSQLYDPQTNANAAYQIYVNAGHNFTPWSTYKTGAYTAYLTTAQGAVA